MALADTLWYRIGYAAGRLRFQRPPGSPGDPVLPLAGAAAGVAAALLLGRRGPAAPVRPLPGLRSIRGLGAGAGAALALALLRWSRPGAARAPVPPPRRVLLEGAGDGLLYAHLVAPRLPGPALLRGLAYGVADCAVGPWGGVSGLLRRALPGSRLPLLDRALPARRGERILPLRDHLVYGLLLALLYGGEA